MHSKVSFSNYLIICPKEEWSSPSHPLWRRSMTSGNKIPTGRQDSLPSPICCASTLQVKISLEKCWSTSCWLVWWSRLIFEIMIIYKYAIQIPFLSVIKMEVSWKHPFTCVVVGPTGCGKTEFVKRFVRHVEDMVTPVPTKIIWSYGEWQPAYKSLLDKVSFVQGLPYLPQYSQEPLLVVIDDQCMEWTNVSPAYSPKEAITETSVSSTSCKICFTSTKNIGPSVWMLIIWWFSKIREMGPRLFTKPSRCIQEKLITFVKPLHWQLDNLMATSWSI